MGHIYDCVNLLHTSVAVSKRETILVTPFVFIFILFKNVWLVINNHGYAFTVLYMRFISTEVLPIDLCSDLLHCRDALTCLCHTSACYRIA